MKSNFSKHQNQTILIADDDEEDRMLTEEALEENQLATQLFFVEDGEEALDYLRHEGKYADKKSFPLPRLILLDLNMPKKDGREVLAEIKQDPLLRTIPVVALTTSDAPEDIAEMYNLGVNSYITKPTSFQDMILAMKSLKQYWFDLVSVPSN